MKRTKIRRAIRTWDDWLDSAKEYRKSNGDLLVPSRYITPDGYKLGRWIERQRAIYNGNTKIKGSLCLDQIAALEAIGMVWKLESRYKWAEWLEFCDDYLLKNDNLLVPKDYIADDVRLGYWITEQREKYHSGGLTQQQINDLNKRKMVWSLGKRRAWNEWYADAKAYYSAHGDLLVPLKYVTPEGELLGQWIFSQRDQRKRSKGYSEDRIADLDAIGMVWDLQEVRDADWERMYLCIKAYAEEHGRLPLWPRNQLAPDGRAMDGWISVQRTRLSNDNVPENQKQKLYELGIYPFGHSDAELSTGAPT